jgi:uncharacterized sulfatase
MAERRPNIIVFFTDQQRPDTCGCYGQSLALTPNLDRMAAEGTRFDLAFTPQPVCGPARAVMQTGRYATETGCFTNAIALRTDEDTIARRLRAAGYEAGYIGKWHLASTLPNRLGVTDGRTATDFTRSPVPPEYRGGYDDFWLAADVLEHTSTAYSGHMFDGAGRAVEMQGFRADWVSGLAVEYVRSRAPERPFLLFLSFIEPHQSNSEGRFRGPDGSREKYAVYDVPGDLAGTGGDWRQQYPDYLGSVAALDRGLGRLREVLEERGIADNTVVLFTSDHGCHFRTRNREYKRSCHDNSIHVPLVAAGPGFAGGGARDEMVSLIDVAPTVLRAAGLDPTAAMRGRALQDLPAGRADGWRDDVFVQISEHEMGRAVRTRRWKYAVHVPDESGWETPWAQQWRESHLYDLSTDPFERCNLVSDAAYADVRAEMRQRLLRHMREVEREPLIEEAPATGTG